MRSSLVRALFAQSRYVSSLQPLRSSVAIALSLHVSFLSCGQALRSSDASLLPEQLSSCRALQRERSRTAMPALLRLTVTTGAPSMS